MVPLVRLRAGHTQRNAMPEHCDISNLLVNPYNREINRDKVESIKQAIKDSGEVRPLVYAEVDHEGKPGKMITDGHHRYHALKELGYKDVPIVMQDERGIKTKAPITEVEKAELIHFIKDTLLEKAWFGDAERHAEAAARRGASSGPEVAEAKAPRPTAAPKEEHSHLVRNVAIATAVGVSLLALAHPATRRLLRGVIEDLYTASKGKIGPEAKKLFGVTMAANPSAIKSAEDYTKKAGLALYQKTKPAIIDSALHSRIADAYGAMKNNPLDPKVKEAYQAFGKEIEAQFKHLPVKVEFTKVDPYKTSEEMMKDVRKTGVLKVFTGGDEHPFLGKKDADGVSLNDKFRAIHDYFGHNAGGFGFSHAGEENAYLSHSKMFSPLAQRALATETRGQTAWFRASKENAGLPVGQRKFPEQKAGLLPEEFWPKSAKSDRFTPHEIDQKYGKVIDFTHNKIKDGGSTVSLKGEPPKERFGLSPYKHRELVADPKDLKRADVANYVHQNQDALHTPGHYLGSWTDDKSGKHYLDVSVGVGKQHEAEQLARENNQVAYYDSKEGKTIYMDNPKKDAASGAVKPREKGKTFLSKAELLEAIRSMAKSYTEKVAPVQKSVTRPGQNVRVKQPDPTIPQANTGEDQDKINSINDELTSMLSGLQQMESIAQQQGLLTNDEINSIIIPLRDNINGLLSAMSSSDDFREGAMDTAETPEQSIGDSQEEGDQEENTWTPTDASNPADQQQAKQPPKQGQPQPGEKPQPSAKPVPQNGNVPSESDPEEEPGVQSRSKKKPEPGPKRQVGTAERSLENPATTFTENKSVNSSDVEKGFSVPGLPTIGGGKGFRGDPQRHADAARARWELQGVPPGGTQKPKNPRQSASDVEDKKPIPGIIRQTAQKTVTQAAHTFARGLGNTVGELGWRAAATVFTIIAYRYLSGESTQVRDLARLGMGGVKAALQRSFQLRRIDNLSRANKMARLVRAWAEKK